MDVLPGDLLTDLDEGQLPVNSATVVIWKESGYFHTRAEARYRQCNILCTLHFSFPSSTLVYTIFLPATFAVVLDIRINIIYWCYDPPFPPFPSGWRPDVAMSNFCCPQWVWFLPGRGAAVWLCCPNLYNCMTVGLREIRSWCKLLSDKFIKCFSHFTSCLLTI